MVFCNNANLLNVFVRHIANNQLRSLAEVATVAHQLKPVSYTHLTLPTTERV